MWDALSLVEQQIYRRLSTIPGGTRQQFYCANWTELKGKYLRSPGMCVLGRPWTGLPRGRGRSSATGLWNVRHGLVAPLVSKVPDGTPSRPLGTTSFVTGGGIRWGAVCFKRSSEMVVTKRRHGVLKRMAKQHRADRFKRAVTGPRDDYLPDGLLKQTAPHTAALT